MKKIYNFNNGVAYPTRTEYRVRSSQGQSTFKFIKEFDKYILKKVCIKNTYRYPFVEFEAAKYELIVIDDDVSNASKYLSN